MEFRVSPPEFHASSNGGCAAAQRGVVLEDRHASSVNIRGSSVGHSASEDSHNYALERFSDVLPTSMPEARRRCAKENHRRVAATKICYRCPICLDTPKIASATRCGHVFCAPCIKRALLEHETCPSCRKAAVICQLRKIYLTAH
ncbi:hypothetical protein BDN71DRAFT_1455242 [Pleurotus eryngii]|uniref:RING-type domain-containing protein n=1 Tax=Pleurotus eryngii TaxID=5323 RepID=A0A9P5ZPG3_PLEER|nr:hypothetical protein BDN71DRAFT_1455242 [Pleurotus eryngii]